MVAAASGWAAPSDFPATVPAWTSADRQWRHMRGVEALSQSLTDMERFSALTFSYYLVLELCILKKSQQPGTTHNAGKVGFVPVSSEAYFGFSNTYSALLTRQPALPA